jgi:hypothetical protein
MYEKVKLSKTYFARNPNPTRAPIPDRITTLLFLNIDDILFAGLISLQFANY